MNNWRCSLIVRSCRKVCWKSKTRVSADAMFYISWLLCIPGPYCFLKWLMSVVYLQLLSIVCCRKERCVDEFLGVCGRNDISGKELIWPAVCYILFPFKHLRQTVLTAEIRHIIIRKYPLRAPWRYLSLKVKNLNRRGCGYSRNRLRIVADSLCNLLPKTVSSISRLAFFDYKLFFLNQWFHCFSDSLIRNF